MNDYYTYVMGAGRECAGKCFTIASHPDLWLVPASTMFQIAGMRALNPELGRDT